MNNYNETIDSTDDFDTALADIKARVKQKRAERLAKSLKAVTPIQTGKQRPTLSLTDFDMGDYVAQQRAIEEMGEFEFAEHFCKQHGISPDVGGTIRGFYEFLDSCIDSYDDGEGTTAMSATMSALQDIADGYIRPPTEEEMNAMENGSDSEYGGYLARVA